MTAGLLLILLGVLWLASRPRWPPRDRAPHMSDRWRRDQLYTSGKQHEHR